MNLKAQRAAAFKAAQDIIDLAKKEKRDLTDEEQTTVEAKIVEVRDLDAKIAAATKSANLVKGLSDLQPEGDDDEDDEEDEASPEMRRKKGGAVVSDFGSAFIKSDAYQAFLKSHPSGVGQGSPVNIAGTKIGGLRDVYRGLKAAVSLTVDQAHVAPVRFPTLDLTYPAPLTLLDLISKGETAGAFEYLQITAVDNNAAIVADATDDAGVDAAGGLKPLSSLTTNLADAKIYTYADGFTVTNSMLSDAPALASYLNNRLSRNINEVIEDKILNGTGANGEPMGIMNDPGVQHQAFDTDMFTTIRRAITKVTQIGGRVTAVVLSPEDDEEWDLAQDANNRYYGGGPFGMSPNTAWGRPRVVSQALAAGTFILGDWATISLLDREGLSVVAFNQHADYARRNLTYIRAELRGTQALFEPAKMVVGDTAAVAP